MSKKECLVLAKYCKTLICAQSINSLKTGDVSVTEIETTLTVFPVGNRYLAIYSLPRELPHAQFCILFCVLGPCKPNSISINTVAGK
jgi:hypothetical protein